jgi:hypothetical protein
MIYGVMKMERFGTLLDQFGKLIKLGVVLLALNGVKKAKL